MSESYKTGKQRIATRSSADKGVDGFRFQGIPAGFGIAFAVESPDGLFVSVL
jgi:hypothetical protein